jgi:hypothetical protein
MEELQIYLTAPFLEGMDPSVGLHLGLNHFLYLLQEIQLGLR